MALAKHSAAQEQKPAAKNKIRVLIDKYGVSKVREALAMIKKYKPNGLIAKYKEASQQVKAANGAFNACTKQHCNQEHREWMLWKRRKYPMGSEVHEKVRAKIKAYMSCRRVHCHQEDSAVEEAYKRIDELGTVIAIAVPLGVLSAAAVATMGAMVLVPPTEQPKPWSQPSPVYEPPKN